MQRITIILVLLQVCLMSSVAQSTTANYIALRTYTNSSGTQWRDKFVYYDELGRETQTVLVGASPQGGSIISMKEYDMFDRESKTWLQGKTSDMTGNFITSKSTVEDFIKASNLCDDNPYALVLYEASPLGRAVTQYGAGVEWQNSGKAVYKEYGVNVSGDCYLNSVHYSVTYTGMTATVANVGNWPTGSQTVIKITDEDGNLSYEFNDRNGKVVLYRQINDGVVLDTYYIRDGWGNLLSVLPPAASSQMTSSGSSWSTSSSDILKTYAYFYKYDSRYRQTGKKLPGCDWVLTVYDSSDTPIMTQNGVQRLNNQWTYTISDVWGRPCVSGICSGNYSEFSTVVKAVRSTTSSSYSFSGLSFALSHILSEIYYDNYAYLGSGGFSNTLSYTNDNDYGERDSNNPIGEITGIKKRVLDSSSSFTYLYQAMYYDYRYRPVQQKATNLFNGVDAEYISYNFDGQPQRRKLIHSANSQSLLTHEYEYTYDTWGRNTTIMHRLNGGTQTTLEDKTYDDIGRLKYMNRNGLSDLQLSYTYNVRSWLTGISNPLFSESLWYNESHDGNTLLWGGNISARQWQTDNTLRGYNLTYDNLSRLTQAAYRENGFSSSKYTTQYSYDIMGNPLTLKRRGKLDDGSYGLVDDLTYTYDGNRLLTITDANEDEPTYQGAFHFTDGAEEDEEYAYDDNGNMTMDLNKGIVSIAYNTLNLPQEVTFQDSNRISYLYDADGNKLRVTYTGGLLSPVPNSVHTVDYCGNYIYEDGTLSRILIDGGYITFESSTPKYHFYIQDHLGNIRVVADQNGVAEQVNHYYPYGGIIADISTNQDIQRHKYNGKEYDRMYGLNLYDYGARHYDPATLTWTTMDPLAEKYYPNTTYGYCFGNPVRFIDPDGKRPKASEAALMAAYAYKDNRQIMEQYALQLAKSGWIVSDYKTSIQMDYTRFNQNGLQSVLFQRTSKGVTEYAYVYAGTNSFEDAVEDVAQLAGAAPQYHTAIYNARTLSNELGNSELTFVGHSLGGGEAIASSMATGRAAITFNPAAVSGLTKQSEGLNKVPNVVNYRAIGSKIGIGNIRLGGDMLNNLQEKIGLSLPGKTIGIPTGIIPTHTIDDFLKHKLPEP